MFRTGRNETYESTPHPLASLATSPRNGARWKTGRLIFSHLVRFGEQVASEASG